MRITGIAVDGVGRFGTPVRLAGLGAGVNILAAGNEAGKSTLFRAVRACLFERHNTRNEFVRNLATDGLSLPVAVTLEFEHDGTDRSEEHTSELQSLMRISDAVFFFKKKNRSLRMFN